MTDSSWVSDESDSSWVTDELLGVTDSEQSDARLPFGDWACVHTIWDEGVLFFTLV